MLMLFAAIGSGYFITSDLQPSPRCTSVIVVTAASRDLNAFLHDRNRICWQDAAPAAQTTV